MLTVVIITAWEVVYFALGLPRWRPRLRPIVEIAEFSNRRGCWCIVRQDPLPRRRAKRKPDWRSCPGTLYQVYASKSQATEVIRWWYGRRARVKVAARSAP